MEKHMDNNTPQTLNLKTYVGTSRDGYQNYGPILFLKGSVGYLR